MKNGSVEVYMYVYFSTYINIYIYMHHSYMSINIYTHNIHIPIVFDYVCNYKCMRMHAYVLAEGVVCCCWCSFAFHS